MRQFVSVEREARIMRTSVNEKGASEHENEGEQKKRSESRTETKRNEYIGSKAACLSLCACVFV